MHIATIIIATGFSLGVMGEYRPPSNFEDTEPLAIFGTYRYEDCVPQVEWVGVHVGECVQIPNETRSINIRSVTSGCKGRPVIPPISSRYGLEDWKRTENTMK